MSFPTSNNYHESRVRELCREYGCQLMRFGSGWRVFSQKVDVIASELRWIQDKDLEPVKANTMAANGR